jgi:hypothetical protein
MRKLFIAMMLAALATPALAETQPTIKKDVCIDGIERA